MDEKLVFEHLGHLRKNTTMVMATIHFKCLVWLFVIFWQESNCERGGNAFSLFNVVNFKNDACSTISTITRYVVGTSTYLVGTYSDDDLIL